MTALETAIKAMNCPFLKIREKHEWLADELKYPTKRSREIPLREYDFGLSYRKER